MPIKKFGNSKFFLHFTCLRGGAHLRNIGTCLVYCGCNATDIDRCVVKAHPVASLSLCGFVDLTQPRTQCHETAYLSHLRERDITFTRVELQRSCQLSSRRFKEYFLRFSSATVSTQTITVVVMQCGVDRRWSCVMNVLPSLAEAFEQHVHLLATCLGLVGEKCNTCE